MDRVTLRRLEDCDISMFKKWLYKEHVAKWYTEPTDWLELLYNLKLKIKLLEIHY